MLKNRGIAFKLILFILISCVVIFDLLLAYNYTVSRKIIIRNVEENAKNLALATVNRIESVLNPIERVTVILASFLEENVHVSESEMESLLLKTIQNNPEIYGGTIAFEPYVFDKDSLYYALYYYHDKITKTYSILHYDNYFYDDWYQIPKELNRPEWSEPYYDVDGGNIIMSTYTVPFYRIVNGKKEVAGVVAADISLEWLQEIVSSIKIYESGYGFLISKNGTFITHFLSSLIMNETIFSVAEERNDQYLRQIGRKMIRGGSGFVPVQSLVSDKSAWMAYESLPSSGWSLGVLFPDNELMADLNNLNRILLILSIIGALLLSVIVVYITGSITRPLRYLVRVTEKIGKGNLDVEIPPIESRDEVGKLTESFVSMQGSLKEYIHQLQETTAAKERIESELQIARDIQMGILPRIFPPFPEREEIDIYAIIAPAREVGGDFYDFFFIDDENLCFCIGDVSGKGVPASLFMAITRTLIKAKTTKGLTPDRVLGGVNDDLCIDNVSSMFVTILLGILNTQTGALSYSIGGHCLPYLISQSGEIRKFDKTQGIALGVINGFIFETKKITIKSGDSIYMFTDGVDEAMDVDGNLYRCERLEAFLKNSFWGSSKEITENSLKDVKKFAAGAPQSDDITILVITFT